MNTVSRRRPRILKAVYRSKEEISNGYISSEQIAEAKEKVDYDPASSVHHKNDDAIRIAYEWLDAQTRTKSVNRKYIVSNNLIPCWGGLYVSRSDIEVAAFLHPEIKGKHRYYNIGKLLVLPNDVRLENIKSAKTQSYTVHHPEKIYKRQEILGTEQNNDN